MRLLSALLVGATWVSAGCAGGDAGAAKAETAPAPVQVGAENVVTVESGSIATGPIISGELRARREATVRAELGGSLLQVNVEEGQAVRRGAIVARIDPATLDDSRRSAESGVRAAEHQLMVARREAERTGQLVSAGALAARDLEVAENNVAAAEAQLADASARLMSAQKLLGDAIVRAPIDGIVADRAVNTGDVVTPGTPLITVIDPSSMRLEASVPSEQLGQLQVGLPVLFTVRGYEQSFEGRIERISPAADPTTRQVPIFVSVPNTGGRLVAGLYAEGRVMVESATGLVVDADAVNTAAPQPWVLRVRDGRTEHVDVVLGVRDPRTERVQITAGVAAADVLLRGPAQSIAPGTQVIVGAPR
jgi:RND family efflux transporter MFP subunit